MAAGLSFRRANHWSGHPGVQPLALLAATDMATPITHFIAFEVGNLINGP
jgi:hypothetical protein